MLHKIKLLKAALPIVITARWVKSHQRECTTREARLNRIADALVATQHQQIGTWASKSTSTMLPYTRAQLHLSGVRYTGKIDRNIQRVLYEEEAWKYVVSKMNFHLAHHLVDWQAR